MHIFREVIFLKTVYVDIEKEMTDRRIKKIAKKLYKLNRKENIVVALSKELEKNDGLVNQINEYGVSILDGRWLFKFLICDIIEYISNMRERKEETEVVAVIMERQDEILLAQLPEIAKKVKTLKIISRATFGLDYLEEKLYNEYGIAIQITNNKQKALTNADIVINFDLKEEKLKEYNINSQATLVNIKENIKNFSGTNINYYKIEYNRENFAKMKNETKFDSNVIYEGFIYRRDTLPNIRKQLILDNVRLIELT